MSRLLPTAAEEALLEFSLGEAVVRRRMLLAAGLFAAGALLLAWLPWPVAMLGAAVILAGHAPVWVRSQSTTPGGATPRHEEIWAPAEEDWLERVRKHEGRGRRWDASPYDLSSPLGFFALVGVALVLAVPLAWLAGTAGVGAGARFLYGAAALLLPLWLNGMRTTWNPSELLKKGESLEAALRTVEEHGEGFEPVPMLALREGRRGKYPVDAKLMLRPVREDGSGFLGVQVQVAMNNVKGTDYPYLYAVVLGEPGFRLPRAAALRSPADGRPLVYEKGEGNGAVFLVVRQHADRLGGWHTEAEDVHRIVWVAMEQGRAAWRTNREEGAP